MNKYSAYPKGKFNQHRIKSIDVVIDSENGNHIFVFFNKGVNLYDLSNASMNRIAEILDNNVMSTSHRVYDNGRVVIVYRLRNS